MNENLAGSWRRWVLVVLAGFGTGVVTQFGESVLPAGWSQAGYAIFPWLLVAFLAGSTMPGRASAGAAGIVTLLFALVGYYATTQIRYGFGGVDSSLIFWGIGAMTGGLVFGGAGRVWRTGTDLGRPFALGLLVAVAIAEGIYHVTGVGEPFVGVGFILAGLLVPLVLGRSWPDRWRAYAAAVPALVIGTLGFIAFTYLYFVIARLIYI